jgi:hypothetical protein
MRLTSSMGKTIQQYDHGQSTDPMGMLVVKLCDGLGLVDVAPLLLATTRVHNLHKAE